MSQELIGIIVADISDLRERMARLEGLLGAMTAPTWADGIDAMMIAGSTWEKLIKVGRALAEKRDYRAPVTLSTLRAHAKYRDSQKSWRVVKMNDNEVQIERVEKNQ